MGSDPPRPHPYGSIQAPATQDRRPELEFAPKDHVKFALRVGRLRAWYEARRRRLLALPGNGVLLEWALLNHFVEAHVRDGYEFVLPPHMLTFAAGYTADQFPKFTDAVFA